MTNLINISSVVPDSAPANKLLVIARWKSSDKRIIAKENMARCIELPANIWGDIPTVTHSNESTTNHLKLLLADAIADIAKSYLATIVEDSNWMRTTVNDDAFTISSLLTWQADTAAVSGRLSGDTIKEWITRSATIAAVKATHGDAIATALGNQFVKLAGPNHGVTSEKAGKLLGSLWKVEDAEDATGLRVLLKLQGIRDKDATADVLDSIL